MFTKIVEAKKKSIKNFLYKKDTCTDTKNFLHNRTYDIIQRDISWAVKNIMIHNPLRHTNIDDKYTYREFTFEFSEFVKNMEELITCIQDQKKKNKLIGQIGNYHYPQSNYCLDFGYKNLNIMDIFDFRIQRAKLPEFYVSAAELSQFKTNGRFEKEKLSDNIFGKNLLGGNLNHLNNVFKKLFGPKFKVLMIGDSPITDCGYFLWKMNTLVNNWEFVLIMNELKDLEASKNPIDKNSNMWPQQFIKGFGNGLIDIDCNGKIVHTFMFRLCEDFERCFSSIYSKSFIDFMKGVL